MSVSGRAAAEPLRRGRGRGGVASWLELSEPLMSWQAWRAAVHRAHRNHRRGGCCSVPDRRPVLSVLGRGRVHAVRSGPVCTDRAVPNDPCGAPVSDLSVASRASSLWRAVTSLLRAGGLCFCSLRRVHTAPARSTHPVITLVLSYGYFRVREISSVTN